jgi:hypothetical protein
MIRLVSALHVTGAVVLAVLVRPLCADIPRTTGIAQPQRASKELFLDTNNLCDQSRSSAVRGYLSAEAKTGVHSGALLTVNSALPAAYAESSSYSVEGGRPLNRCRDDFRHGPANNAFVRVGLSYKPQFPDQVCHASQLVEATEDAKILACIDALPATGGVVDGIGVKPGNPWNTCPFNRVTKSVVVRLGFGSHAIVVNCSVPANVTIDFTNGAVLSPIAPASFTLKGPIVAPATKIFGGDGKVSFDGPGSSAPVRAEWFGVSGDGQTDDTVALQAAITAIESDHTLILGHAAAYVVSQTLRLTHVADVRIMAEGLHGGNNNRLGMSTIIWNGPNNGTVLELDCVRDSNFEGIGIVPGSGTIGVGVDIDQIVPKGGELSANNKFVRFTIDSTVGVPGAAFFVGLKQSIDGNNAEHTFEDVYITGVGTYGYYIRYSQTRNISIMRGSIAGRRYGVYHNNGSSREYGVNLSGNATDFYFAQPDDTINIIGCHSEESGRFIDTGGPGGNTFAAGLYNNQFNVTSNTITPMIRYRFLGPFVMVGNDFADGQYSSAVFELGTSSRTTVMSIGNRFPNDSIFSGDSDSFVLTSIGDQYLDVNNESHKMPNVLNGGLSIDALTLASAPVTSGHTNSLVLTGMTNVSSTSSAACQYLQVSAVVSASCKFVVVPIKDSMLTEFRSTVPVSPTRLEDDWSAPGSCTATTLSGTNPQPWFVQGGGSREVRIVGTSPVAGVASGGISVWCSFSYQAN